MGLADFFYLLHCNFDKILGQFEYIKTCFGFSGTAVFSYVYLLPKEFASQLRDDNGKLIDEFLIKKTLPFISGYQNKSKPISIHDRKTLKLNSKIPEKQNLTQKKF